MAIFPKNGVIIEKKLKGDKITLVKTKEETVIKKALSLVLGDWLVSSLLTLVVVAIFVIANTVSSKTLTMPLWLFTSISVVGFGYVVYDSISKNRTHNLILTVIYLILMLVPYTDSTAKNMFYGTIIYISLSIFAFTLLKYDLEKTGVYIIKDIEENTKN